MSLSLAQPLDIVMNYCHSNELLPLTILVVKKRTGIPGHGLTTIEDLNGDREKVFNHKWYRMKPISLSDLENK